MNSRRENGVSIVIVTFNGAARLQPTLEHLALQKDIDFPVEVVLVNNNSTDATVQTAEDYWKANGEPFPLHIFLEPRPGTMFARKTGIEKATYRYILYCDDDNWLCPEYVATAYNIISSDQEIAAVGGKGNIQYAEGFTPPEWIIPYEINFGNGPQGKKDGDITYSKGCLYTAGAILDTVWLEKLYKKGFVSSLNGRDGKTLVAGEDTELTMALKLIGGKLYYSSAMHFQHYMPPARITWAYLKKLYYAFGYAGFTISPYFFYFKKRPYPSRKKLLKKHIKILLKLLRRKLREQPKEGDRLLLDIAQKKGELKAILSNYQNYQSNIEVIEKIRPENNP